MRAFRTKVFSRFARKVGLGDADLLQAEADVARAIAAGELIEVNDDKAIS